MGSWRPNFRSERPDLGSERPDFGSERPDLGSDRPAMGSERPKLRSRPGFRLGGDRQTHGQMEKITLCGIIGHRPLRGRCPKRIFWGEDEGVIAPQ